MRIVFSRKGFDSASGGGASPIVDGRPLSLPIPAARGLSRTRYGALGLGAHAAHASRGRLGAHDDCHHDPMFLPDGTCLFGQCGAAQTHLENRGVGAGDVFVFFGLFREAGRAAHHRIFGMMRVEEMVPLANCTDARLEHWRMLGHPHALGLHARNDALWIGPGRTAGSAPPGLRLSVMQGPPSLWHVPGWLKQSGLSYHDSPERWRRGGLLQSVARGQEFVADIGRRKEPRAWLEEIARLIEA